MNRPKSIFRILASNDIGIEFASKLANLTSFKDIFSVRCVNLRDSKQFMPLDDSKLEELKWEKLLP